MFYPKTKIEILRLLNDGNWWTAKDIARALGMREFTVGDLLRKYTDQGLLTRRLIREKYGPPRGFYYYKITPRGMNRYNWYLTIISPAKEFGKIMRLEDVYEIDLSRWFAKKFAKKYEGGE